MKKEICLRCHNDLMITQSSDNITFYECKQCQRAYVKSKGKSLTDRWGAPISLLLYSIIFKKQKVSDKHITHTAIQLLESSDRYEVKVMIEDIDEELDTPKQKLTDMLNLMGTEEIARDYLSRLSIELKKRLL